MAAVMRLVNISASLLKILRIKMFSQTTRLVNLPSIVFMLVKPHWPNIKSTLGQWVFLFSLLLSVILIVITMYINFILDVELS